MGALNINLLKREDGVGAVGRAGGIGGGDRGWFSHLLLASFRNGRTDLLGFKPITNQSLESKMYFPFNPPEGREGGGAH